MAVSLKHQFVSNVADSPDATLVQPSNWNAEHTLTANANSLLGAVTAGNVVEVTCTSAGRALLDDADAPAQRTTLGLGTISTQNSNNVSITGGSITGITDIAVADGGTGASDAPTARTNLGIGTLGTQNANAVAITGGTIVANASGISIRDADASNVMTIAVGSNLTANTTLTLTTGATTSRTLDISATNVTVSVAGAALIDDADASAQRTTLGLGTIATQNANNVSITGGSITGITDLAVADGGTGASDASTARTNLGIGTMGTQNANAVAITGGTIVANASGISIRDADASNVMTIAVGSNLTANTTLTLTTGATTNRTLDISATNVTISTAGAALIDDADAAAQRTTLGLGTIATQNANAVSITGGSITGITDLAVADGGTGASDAGTARTNLGLAIGTDVQAYSARLSEIAALAPTADNFIVGSGTSWILETPAAARTSLGLGTISTQNSNNVSITGGSVTGITDLAVADGGTGASDAGTARTNLGIGTIATQNSNNVSITGGSVTGITDLVVADGGTGVGSFTAYSVILGGTTSTGALQNVSGVGTSGQFLKSNGANTAPSWASVTASGTLIRAPQVLTSGTSYTTPAGCVSIYVEAVGAGGAGGGVGGAIAGSAGGGGGSGGYCAKFFAVSASTAYSYAIGAGGTGIGGNTTFTVGATTITAGGGGQGENANLASQGRRGGTGGTSTSGDTNITGNVGGVSHAAANDTNAAGGSGAGSFFGGGGRGASNGGNGTAGTSGGGGGGATPSGGGGNGGSGLIRIWEFT